MLSPRLVCCRDVGDGPGPLTVQLQNRLALGPGEMPRPRGPVAERTGDQRSRGRTIEPLPHPQVERAGHDRHVLGLRVPMRKHLEAVRESQAHRENAGLRRIDIKEGHLGDLRYSWRLVLTLDLLSGLTGQSALTIATR